MNAGRLIAFEGVDGAGKSTALRVVAERLKQLGVPVFLPRTGKEHVSRPTRMIRQLTRDPRNFELSARSELLLYCAREAQVLLELVSPALARGQTVLVDRSLLTPVVLGMSRGLSRDECESAARLASAGIEPELTLVFDVHPRTSRLRKRLERIRTHTLGEGGRKGLAGSAFKTRVREAYQQIAAERGYPVFHVERASPELLAERVVKVVLSGPGAGTGEDALDATPRWLVPPEWSFERALESLPLPEALYFADGLVSARALRKRALASEPALAAFTLDAEDPLREQAAQHEAEYALRAWYGRPLSGPDDLRLRVLAAAPGAAIMALRYLYDAESERIRAQYAEQEPDAVLVSLAARDDAAGWKLRDACWKAGSEEARAQSLIGCTSERGFELRAQLFDKNPVLGLESLRSVHDARGDAWLERHAPHAPKAVLAALAGRSDPFAYRLRDELFETGREVVDTVRRLDDDAAFALRERALERWPSTVAHSLLGVPDSPRVSRMLARCEELAGGDLHVRRRLSLLSEQPLAPRWVQARSRQSLVEVAAE